MYLKILYHTSYSSPTGNWFVDTRDTYLPVVNLCWLVKVSWPSDWSRASKMTITRWRHKMMSHLRILFILDLYGRILFVWGYFFDYLPSDLRRRCHAAYLQINFQSVILASIIVGTTTNMTFVYNIAHGVLLLLLVCSINIFKSALCTSSYSTFIFRGWHASAPLLSLYLSLLTSDGTMSLYTLSPHFCAVPQRTRSEPPQSVPPSASALSARSEPPCSESHSRGL